MVGNQENIRHFLKEKEYVELFEVKSPAILWLYLEVMSTLLGEPVGEVMKLMG